MKYVTDHAEDESAKDSVKLICEQLFDLARIQNAPLAADDMEKFVARSNDVLMLLTGEK